VTPGIVAERPLAGAAIRLLAAAALAIMFALVKWASEHGVHVVEALFYRQALAIPLMLVIAFRSGGLGSLRTQRPGGHALRMALGISAMLLNYLTFTLLPLADATVIGFSVPLFATLCAIVLLGEIPGVWRWSALILGFAGVAIVAGPMTAIADTVAVVIAMTGAVLTSLTTIQIRNLSRTEAAATIVFWFTLTSMVPLGIAMLWFGQLHPPDVWLVIGGLSLAGAIGQWALTEALRLAPVAVVMPMDYSSLLWAALLGWWLFDQWPLATTWLGAPLIIGSGLVILWREHYLARARPA
jgi:drug/metabolite transporter (DMT)-like permease